LFLFAEVRSRLLRHSFVDCSNLLSSTQSFQHVCSATREPAMMWASSLWPLVGLVVVAQGQIYANSSTSTVLGGATPALAIPTPGGVISDICSSCTHDDCSNSQRSECSSCPCCNSQPDCTPSTVTADCIPSTVISWSVTTCWETYVQSLAHHF
jgi:hypothetical protein